jgi:DNA-binding CsgD family transcriptional regulator/tetratricopeptide (TPR) repeat protein
LLPINERAELFDHYADECEVTAQMNEAEHAQEEALRLWRELGEREREGRALRRLSEIAMRLKKKAEMGRYVSESIDVLETHPPSKELAMAYSHKSRIHMVVFQMDETINWAMRAIKLAEQLGDAETSIHSLASIGMIEMWRNQFSEGKIKLEKSLNLSLEHDYHYHAARALFNLAVGSLNSFEYGACLAYVDEGLDYCISHDFENWKLGLISLRARAKFEQGRWDESKREIRSAQEHWDNLGFRPHVEFLNLMLQIRHGEHLSPDDFEKLRDIALSSIYHSIIYPIAMLFAEEAWLRDDLGKCRIEVETLFQNACRLKIPRFIGELAYWMWRAGAITEPPPNAAEPYATQIRGDWRAAASMWEKYGCPYEQGMALMDGDEAAQLKALEIFESLGARPIIEKLKRQMQVQGIRVPRGPRPATRENRFGLTPREMEVLGYLVKGMSNPAIAGHLSLSVRTVEHHIASILRKMDVGSRSEAAALAIQVDLL